MRRAHRLSALIAVLSMIAGLAGTAEAISVVATTTLVADVVRAVAGNNAQIVTLLPPNADPHSFEPTPRDVVSVSKADVVFISGANLEAQFANILANARGPVVDLSTRIALRYGADIEHDHDEAGSGEEGDHHEEAHDHGEFDPHVWFDPTNVMIWTAAIEETLCELDPDNSAVYASNAAAYRRALVELDLWIWEQVARLPYGNRDLVTDHLAFGYFAARYGFRQVGAIFPGLSPLAEPSAKELSDLVDTIELLGVPAVFVGTTVNPAVAEQVAADTGSAVVSLYTGSLSDPGGPAASYIDFMRYDVEAIVEALTR